MTKQQVEEERIYSTYTFTLLFMLVSASNCTTSPLHRHACTHTHCPCMLLQSPALMGLLHIRVLSRGHVHCPHLRLMPSYTHMRTAVLESAGTCTLKSTALLASVGMYTHIPIAPCSPLKAPAPTCSLHPWDLQAQAVTCPLPPFSLCRQLHFHFQYPALSSVGIYTYIPAAALCSLHGPAHTCPLPHSAHL